MRTVFLARDGRRRVGLDAGILCTSSVVGEYLGCTPSHIFIRRHDHRRRRSNERTLRRLCVFQLEGRLGID